MSDLAKKAVACKGWRWLPGMQGVDAAGRQWRRNIASWTGEGHSLRIRNGQVLPDLTDPATLGCLLALVREAWGDTEAYTRTRRGPPSLPLWAAMVMQRDGNKTARVPAGLGATEAEALVAALEAAPIDVEVREVNDE